MLLFRVSIFFLYFNFTTYLLPHILVVSSQKHMGKCGISYILLFIPVCSQTCGDISLQSLLVSLKLSLFQLQRSNVAKLCFAINKIFKNNYNSSGS